MHTNKMLCLRARGTRFKNNLEIIVTEKLKGFFAYASNPSEIGQTIEAAVKSANMGSEFIVETWRALDIPGHFISEMVIEGIDNCDFLVADISVLNFNVTYEIAYAIGKGKRVFITKNSSIREVSPTIREVGIFDTLGFQTYQNSSELASHISNACKVNPLKIPNKINTKSPVYLMEGLHKTDWASRIVSRIKKARYLFRSFDPNEQPRLSANDAISQVAQSHGVVVPLLSSTPLGQKSIICVERLSLGYHRAWERLYACCSIKKNLFR